MQTFKLKKLFVFTVLENLGRLWLYFLNVVLLQGSGLTEL